MSGDDGRDRLMEVARAMIEPHYRRLYSELGALRREGYRGDDLVVEVPDSWPKEFDEGSALFGMPIRKADIAEPRVARE